MPNDSIFNCGWLSELELGRTACDRIRRHTVQHCVVVATTISKARIACGTEHETYSK